ncbi:hypothetical protein EAF00_005125 [Botryotinia globosa]|nr:hypothetical protein EAF00_005125 [Botryotinia globosa]
MLTTMAIHQLLLLIPHGQRCRGPSHQSKEIYYERIFLTVTSQHVEDEGYDAWELGIGYGAF